MRIFDHPNMDNFRCPVCGTTDDKPVVLIGRQATLNDGIMEAYQVHLHCIELTSVVLPDGRTLYLQQVDRSTP